MQDRYEQSHNVSREVDIFPEQTFRGRALSYAVRFTNRENIPSIRFMFAFEEGGQMKKREVRGYGAEIADIAREFVIKGKELTITGKYDKRISGKSRGVTKKHIIIRLSEIQIPNS